MRKHTLITILVVLFGFAISNLASAGKNGCPPGVEACYTAKHKITGDVMCVPETSKRVDPGVMWERVADGCEELPVPSFTPELLVILPTPTPTQTPITTIIPSVSVSIEPTATLAPNFFEDVDPQQVQGAACSVCEDSCTCLLVTQEVLQNKILQGISDHLSAKYTQESNENP